MPSHSKGPRLWRRPIRRKEGRIVGSAVWIIKDGGNHIATGCVALATDWEAPVEAQKALARYIQRKYQPSRLMRGVGEIDIADVLAVYHHDTKERQSNRQKFDSRILRLNAFFGDNKLSQLKSHLCAAYVVARGNSGGSRRDLEDLRAAVRHHAKENLHDAQIHVALPPKGAPRERWLTRNEVAKLIWTCWRHRELQKVHHGDANSARKFTQKFPLRHLVPFILIGVYTGTRSSAILNASPIRKEGNSFVDLDHGVFYRRAEGRRVTNKRQPPVPIPPRLQSHMRRWVDKRKIVSYFVEWNGRPVSSVKTAWATAIKLAGLDQEAGHVIPHTLRHTAATWLMQQGVDVWQAAGFLGMSPDVLIGTYGHHHPNHMREAADAITKRRKTAQTVVETVVRDIRYRR